MFASLRWVQHYSSRRAITFQQRCECEAGTFRMVWAHVLVVLAYLWGAEASKELLPVVFLGTLQSCSSGLLQLACLLLHRRGAFCTLASCSSQGAQALDQKSSSSAVSCAKLRSPCSLAALKKVGSAAYAATLAIPGSLASNVRKAPKLRDADASHCYARH